MTEKKLLTVEEAARVLGIGRSMAFSLVASRQLSSIKIGRSRRVPTACLDAWITAQMDAQGFGREEVGADQKELAASASGRKGGRP
jgi:excisionase family DNA binding protein